MRARFILCAAILLLSSGCREVFTSESLVRAVDKDQRAIGLSYALPKAVIRGKLVVDPNTAAFVLCMLAAPIPIADASQQYYMPFKNNPFSADTYTISKDETTGSIKKIDVRTIDRSNEFAVNIGRSAGAVRAALNQEGGLSDRTLCASANQDVFVLATFEIDPADDYRTRGDMAAINEVMLRFAQRRAAMCQPSRLPRGEVLNEDDVVANEACREYHRIKRSYSHHKPAIHMNWLLPPAPHDAPKPDCSVGFCYRHVLPHTVQIAMAGSSVHAYTFQIPNASPIVAMDITRAITVTKTTVVDFGSLGQITNIKVQKGKDDGTVGSEAEGLALIPFNVINAYFGAVSSTSQIIGQAFTSEKTLIENKLARDTAQYDSIKKHREMIKQEGGEVASSEDYAITASNGMNTTKVKKLAAVTDKPVNTDGGADAPLAPAVIAPQATPPAAAPPARKGPTGAGKAAN